MSGGLRVTRGGLSGEVTAPQPSFDGSAWVAVDASVEYARGQAVDQYANPRTPYANAKTLGR